VFAVGSDGSECCRSPALALLLPTTERRLGEWVLRRMSAALSGSSEVWESTDGAAGPSARCSELLCSGGGCRSGWG
jgi:hypothetical protein